MYGYIYKITNKIDNKIYIGQHKCIAISDNYFGSGINIRRAIRKYGKQNFRKEILKICESKEDLDNSEIKYISEYKSIDPEIGYNISKGGQSKFFTGLKHSSYSKKLMSEKAKLHAHLPTTLGRIAVHKDTETHIIHKDQLNTYLEKGYELGNSYKQKPWNKGLSKETNSQLAKQSLERKKKFLDKGSIGCFGLKGKANFNHNENKLLSISNNDFYTYWYENGKIKTMKKFHIGYSMYNQACKILNIKDTPEHNFYIRSKCKNN